MQFFAFGFFALLTISPAQASDWRGITPDNSPHHAFAATIDPVYKAIFESVSREKEITLLQQLTGYIPVTVNGSTFSITDRFTDKAKANFRAFWTQYFTALGIPVQDLEFRGGHNLEAVLPGKSKDSVVVIVHYDSMGPRGGETTNPAVDDDMTGMTTLMETARVLAAHKGELQNTVRFVAADLEEQGGLAGARQYANYLKAAASAGGFKIIAAVDNEQSGWNCAADDSCGISVSAATLPPVDIFSCSGDGMGYNYQAMGDALANVTSSYSGLGVHRGCIGENSDHYAMWEIGVPSVVFSEHDPFENPHFDESGGDTFDKIDQNYFFGISQVGVTFAATLAGLGAH